MYYVDIIFNLLEKNRITAKAFAEAVGVSQGNVTDWKNKRSKPSVTVLSKIADYFNVSTDYLLGREKAPAMQGLSEDERQLLTSFRAASEDGRRSILRVAMNECRGLDIDESHIRFEQEILNQSQDSQEEREA